VPGAFLHYRFSILDPTGGFFFKMFAMNGCAETLDVLEDKRVR
jgi:hypothetical protein